ncbi:MAG TPA: glycoside hydrolase family 38 C-terminal domain-containing protein [Anaerolineae bacterium]|nr:glycoside hydrolase family 38 C-terminal domain-containing protein [Anaerolineae bacterium]
MPSFRDYTKPYLESALTQIGDAVYTVVGPLDIRAWWSREPLPFAQRRSGKELALSVGDKWGDLFDCAWFHFTGQVPAAAAGHHVVLLLDVNGEMCVCDAQGVPVRGLTNVSSTYDYSLGQPGKRVLQVTARAQGGERIDVWADAGCNDLFGDLCENGTVKEASIAICNDAVRALYYDFEVLLDLLKVLPEDSPRHQQILTGLNDVAHRWCDAYPLSSGIPAVTDKARAALAPLLAKRGGDPSLRISAIGHAHVDLAWLWPIRETIRKGARTFSTAIALMDRYPDYVFGASQPQYFLWMKERYPALYAKIKEKVRAGRIEPLGAMWVEPDTNIAGGEALVRQLLHGKRFFKQEFGVDVNHLWLPDVFGYSAALPQLLKLAGVDYFSTQKLSWSLINVFPHQSFHWQGIDGTTVLAHMLPEDTYNSPAAPHSVHKIERNYKDKGVSEHALMVFGIGDGGGGPGAEHLERLTRIKNLAGLSPVTQEPVAAFFERWQQDAARFPTWVGELYLERHQGTLTTGARNKRYNRKMELALRELEWTSVLASVLAGAAYPSDRLEAIWREVLLYQFHDILPGSSIKRVVDESVARYRAMHREVTALIAENDAHVAGCIHTAGMTSPVLVQNSLSWERAEWVQAHGRWLHVTVPAMGYKVVDADTDHLQVPGTSVSATETRLENDLLRVQFAEDGSIVSIYDKRAGRQVIPDGQAANRLAVYRDPGDAWDFCLDYAEQALRTLELVSAAARVDGPRAVLRQVYRLAHSELTQEIALTAGSPRLDFISHLRWREPQTMLRTSFPVAVHAEDATFEIQFGHIRRPTHRNTTWDLAKDEVAAHKWVDLSQRDYGVALLNDSKYGHKVKGNVIDLNLLRSVPYPGPRLVQDADVAPGEPHHAYTDQCDHVFTYALYPHPGDHVEGRVVQAGYALNVPLRVVPVASQRGERPVEASFLQVDAPNVIVEAVKKAEEAPRGENAIIVRLYECEHRSTRATLHFGFPVDSATESNLMEEPLGPLTLRNNRVTLDFRPFEVKTVRATKRA